MGFEEKLYKRGPGDYFIYGHGGETSLTRSPACSFFQPRMPGPGSSVSLAQSSRQGIQRCQENVVKKAVAKKEAAPKLKRNPRQKKPCQESSCEKGSCC
jgi:hypothetical protein